MTPSVCVGVRVQSEPERLRATLGSLRANTPLGIDLVLVPDDPDPVMRAALASEGRVLARR